LYTHDFTPIINWTNGTDSNGNQIDMFVCILSDPTTDTCDVYGDWTNQSNLTNFPGLNHSGIWYVNITTNDGTVNGTTYTTNFTINNTLPVASALLNNDTHDQTPTVTWTVTDPDDGSDYFWPADMEKMIIIIQVMEQGIILEKQSVQHYLGQHQDRIGLQIDLSMQECGLEMALKLMVLITIQQYNYMITFLI